jgi:hypothetical protein
MLMAKAFSVASSSPYGCAELVQTTGFPASLDRLLASRRSAQHQLHYSTCYTATVYMDSLGDNHRDRQSYSLLVRTFTGAYHRSLAPGR